MYISVYLYKAEVDVGVKRHELLHFMISSLNYQLPDQTANTDSQSRLARECRKSCADRL
jgi:hypothetical protein